MPKNRQDRTREEKSSEIVAIAQKLFLEKGYAGTTIAAIAREARIASNVVHWYFPTKDELFVAALDSLQAKGLDELATRHLARSTPGAEESDLESLLTELVWRRLDLYDLIATVHERSHCSSVVAAFHDRAHRRYAACLGRAVARFPADEAEQKLIVEALITALEGLVMHRVSKPKARRMMAFLVQRLVRAD